MKIYLVMAEHFSEPGRPITAHATRDLATKSAVPLVNLLRSSVDLPPVSDASTWEAALLEAREKRASDLGCELADLGEDDGDVWITELEVEGAAVPDAPLSISDGDIPTTCIRFACDHLRQARKLLTLANAQKATGKVRAALKSSEGALRHAQGVASRDAESRS